MHAVEVDVGALPDVAGVHVAVQQDRFDVVRGEFAGAVMCLC